MASCNVTSLTKGQFRQYVTERCHKNNEERLREQAEGKSKCDRIIKEEYKKKSYVTERDIEDVRKMYRTRYGLSPVITPTRESMREQTSSVGVRRRGRRKYS